MRQANLPAFPRPASEYTRDGTLADGNDAVPAQAGISKREYFAAKAMQGLLVTTSREPATLETVARLSVEVADALLAALEGTS